MPTLAMNLDPGSGDEKLPKLPPGITMTRTVVSQDKPGPVASVRPLVGQRALEVKLANQHAPVAQKVKSSKK